MTMTVSQLINILRDLDPSTEVCLGVDQQDEDGDWETNLVPLTIDDVATANTYVAFQVPSTQEFSDDNE